jgi:hypothetical protein
MPNLVSRTHARSTKSVPVSGLIASQIIVCLQSSERHDRTTHALMTERDQVKKVTRTADTTSVEYASVAWFGGLVKFAVTP